MLRCYDAMMLWWYDAMMINMVNLFTTACTTISAYQHITISPYHHITTTIIHSSYQHHHTQHTDPIQSIYTITSSRSPTKFRMKEEEDLPYEEDVLRNPYFLKSWIRYLDFKREASSKARNMISLYFILFCLLLFSWIYLICRRYTRGHYESCLEATSCGTRTSSRECWQWGGEKSLILPLRQWTILLKGLSFSCIRYGFARVVSSEINSIDQMPRIWLDYCQFLVDQELVTRTRRTFDRALRSLPITQHDKIWKISSSFFSLFFLVTIFPS